MSGSELVVDTNIFINLGTEHWGIDKILHGNRIYLSIISEIEILGFHKISEADTLFLQVYFLNVILLICRKP